MATETLGKALGNETVKDISESIKLSLIYFSCTVIDKVRELY